MTEPGSPTKQEKSMTTSTDLSCGIDMCAVVDVDSVWVLKRIMAKHVDVVIMVMIVNQIQTESDRKPDCTFSCEIGRSKRW